MAIEARYFDKNQDFQEVGREKIAPGEFFHEVRTGTTPDGQVEVLHVVEVLDDTSIYGYTRTESKWGDEQASKTVQGEDVNGTGWCYFNKPDKSNPNIGLILKYVPDKHEEVSKD